MSATPISFPENRDLTKRSGNALCSPTAKHWFARLEATISGPGNAAVRLADCEANAARRVVYTLVSTDDLEAATATANAWPLLPRAGVSTP
jgi:hypothetical protein